MGIGFKENSARLPKKVAKETSDEYHEGIIGIPDETSGRVSLKISGEFLENFS